MRGKDKRELIEAINAHTTAEIDKLAIATKKGFDEAQRERQGLSERFGRIEIRVGVVEEVVSENQDRLKGLESSAFRLTHPKKSVQ
jgi:hypothetical protein